MNKSQLSSKQTPFCIWLTGLSGSGKSTIANQLEINLKSSGSHCVILDGDKIRLGLCQDLGFSIADRSENIRRVAEVARLFVDAGLIVIVAFISPLRKQRDFARSLFEPQQFIEIYLDTPLHQCELRDPKGLYSRARGGEIKDFTGIDSPYEPPLDPELIIDTSCLTIENSVSIILNLLKKL